LPPHCESPLVVDTTPVLPEVAVFMPAWMRSHCQPAFLVGVNGLLMTGPGSFCLMERCNSTTPQRPRLPRPRSVAGRRSPRMPSRPACGLASTRAPNRSATSPPPGRLAAGWPGVLCGKHACAGQRIWTVW
jgi:hypothetical protein